MRKGCIAFKDTIEQKEMPVNENEKLGIYSLLEGRTEDNTHWKECHQLW